MTVAFTLDGQRRSFDIEPGRLLSELLHTEGLLAEDQALLRLDGHCVDSTLLLAAQIHQRRLDTHVEADSLTSLPALVEEDLELEAHA